MCFLARLESLEQVCRGDLAGRLHAKNALRFDARLDLRKGRHGLSASVCRDLLFLALAAGVHIGNPPAAPVYPLKHSIPLFSLWHHSSAQLPLQSLFGDVLPSSLRFGPGSTSAACSPAALPIPCAPHVAGPVSIAAIHRRPIRSFAWSAHPGCLPCVESDPCPHACSFRSMIRAQSVCLS